VDFSCGGCGAEFQLKAKAGRLGRKLRDAAYEPMMERITAGRSPHFAFLEYSQREWKVHSLLLVPGHFFNPGIIERCKPLSDTARRAGWIGCNILADRLPPDGRLLAVSNGVAKSSAVVREEWKKFAWMAKQPAQNRGWTADILRIVRKFENDTFRLADVYSFSDELASLHPDNRNIEAKIRQQLQILRNQGILRFLGGGKYQAL
jgi:type II restriction enzyme